MISGLGDISLDVAEVWLEANTIVHGRRDKEEREHKKKKGVHRAICGTGGGKPLPKLFHR
jgi:hypothetical protein